MNRKNGIILIGFLSIIAPAMASDDLNVAVQNADFQFYSKVLLVVIIALVGILTIRTYNKSDEAN